MKPKYDLDKIKSVKTNGSDVVRFSWKGLTGVGRLNYDDSNENSKYLSE